MISLAAEYLRFAYNNSPVVEDVSVQAEPGQVLGILGPNGAGKSTLLRLLLGILKPSQGRVLLDGQPLESFTRQQLAQKVAFVPQSSSTAFGFPVWDVVAMGRTPFAGRFEPLNQEDYRLIDEAMAKVEATPFSDRRLSDLSGGERQRVFLARALAQSTPALLLDEPVANLDPYHELQILELMRTLAGEGKTVVCVLHHLDQAARYCDQLAVLCNGRLVSKGTPAEVLTTELLRTVFRIQAELMECSETGWRLVIRGRETNSPPPSD